MELHYRSLKGLAHAIERGDTTPTEVCRHMLERIERLNPALKAYVTVCEEQALAQAERLEKLPAQGGPLHGVPIGIKDLCDTAGIRTSMGMPCFADRIPSSNATVVQRLLDAGAVVLGKLVMSEAAGPLHHESELTPVNPHSASHWTGVSSSGSGVATAAGLCFASTASDTAGSIRFPSASNGVVGIMPTAGRVPLDGVFPLGTSLDSVGPLARSVEDAAIMLGVMVGASAGDQKSSTAGNEDFVGALEKPATELVLGIDESYCTEGAGSEVSSGVLAAAEKYREMGVTVKPVEMPDLAEVCRAFCVVFHSELAAVHEPLLKEHGGRYSEHLQKMIEVGLAHSGVEYARAHDVRQRFRGQMERFFHGVDAMLCPPAISGPPPVEVASYIPVNMADMVVTIGYTAPYNFIGLPTLTLPCGFTDEGVPLGMQLVGNWFGDACLLRLGHAYQSVTDWHERRPDFSGRASGGPS